MVDIRSAEVGMQRAMQYLNEVWELGVNPYEKSRRRISALRDIGLQVADMANKILSERVFKTHPSNNSSENLDLQSQLSQLSKQLEEVRQYLNLSSNSDSSGTERYAEPQVQVVPNVATQGIDYNSHISEVDEDDTPEGIGITLNTRTVETTSVVNSVERTSSVKVTLPKRSPKEKRKIIKDYISALQSGGSTACGYALVDQCANLIWRWFNARILTTYSNSPFTYSIHRISHIIQSIVIAFGYHTENDDLTTFCSQFSQWEDELSKNPNSNTWIAPYEIYQIERGKYDNYITQTALVLWDILVAIKYQQLLQDDPYYLHDSDIWNLAAEQSPEVLDTYRYYVEYPEILESLNIV